MIGRPPVGEAADCRACTRHGSGVDDGVQMGLDDRLVGNRPLPGHCGSSRHCSGAPDSRMGGWRRRAIRRHHRHEPLVDQATADEVAHEAPPFGVLPLRARRKSMTSFLAVGAEAAGDQHRPSEVASTGRPRTAGAFSAVYAPHRDGAHPDTHRLVPSVRNSHRGQFACSMQPRQTASIPPICLDAFVGPLWN